MPEDSHSTNLSTESSECRLDAVIDFDALAAAVVRPSTSKSSSSHGARYIPCSSDTTYIPGDGSTLSFEDHGPRDPTAEEEVYAPPPDVRTAQDELFRNLRCQDLRAPRSITQQSVPKAARAASQLSSKDQFQLCNDFPVQISTDRHVLSDLEQATPLTASETAIKALGQNSDEYSILPMERIMNQGLVDDKLVLRLDSTRRKDIESAVQHLKDNGRTNVSAFKDYFWNRYIFNLHDFPPKAHSEHELVHYIPELRLKLVAHLKGMDLDNIPKDRRDRDRRRQLRLPGTTLKVADTNQYAWFDIAYAVEACATRTKFSNQTERLKRLPINRIFWTTDPEGKRMLAFYYLCHIFIEIRPLYDDSLERLGKQTQKTVDHLVLNASVCLHEYMKLLWLGSPIGSDRFQGELPVLYLIAAVGFTAEVYCMHVRDFNDEERKKTKTRYEAVLLGSFDLTTREGQDSFSEQYNSIHALAQYYATQHRKAMEMAMTSGRDVATTKIPGLRFLQFIEDGQKYFQMVDKDGILQYEGPELLILEAKEEMKEDESVPVTHNPQSSRWIMPKTLHGPLVVCQAEPEKRVRDGSIEDQELRNLPKVQGNSSIEHHSSRIPRPKAAESKGKESTQRGSWLPPSSNALFDPPSKNTLSSRIPIPKTADSKGKESTREPFPPSSNELFDPPSKNTRSSHTL